MGRKPFGEVAWNACDPASDRVRVPRKTSKRLLTHELQAKHNFKSLSVSQVLFITSYVTMEIQEEEPLDSLCHFQKSGHRLSSLW